MAGIQNIPPEKRARGNPAWKRGGGSPNPGGRPKKLREIEAMLDAEHRTVANMREVFTRLKALAMGEVVTVRIPGGDGETELKLDANPGFVKLYLERVIGPVKDVEEIDLSDAPPEVIDYLRNLQ